MQCNCIVTISSYCTFADYRKENKNGCKVKGIMEDSSCSSDKIDFVIVWEEKHSDPSYSDKKKKRDIFFHNLQQEGLIIKDIKDGDLRWRSHLKFSKVYAPMEILRSYAEILKLRLPIKKFAAERLHSESADPEGADFPEIKLAQIDAGECHKKSVIQIPIFSEVHHEIKSWIEKIEEPFFPSEKFHRNSIKTEYTALYSRDKDYLFDHDDDFFSLASRSRIVEFLLKRTRFSDDPEDDFAFGVTKLIHEGSVEACYPLHDGDLHTPGSQRKLLYDEWASVSKFWKYQPLDAIRDYYGVKIGLYFAWLGFYTFMLVPPSLVGIACFIYGLITLSSDVPSHDICEGSMKNVTMCPICDQSCQFWPLQEACRMTQAKYLFDNGTTVFFALFMSLWAVIFTEMWKRYSAEITHRWDVFGYDPEEEYPRPEYLAKLSNVKERTINFITQTTEPKPPFWKMKLPGILISWSIVMFFITLSLITVVGIIIYRMSMVVAHASVPDVNIKYVINVNEIFTN